jgi:hypothetical protein
MEYCREGWNTVLMKVILKEKGRSSLLLRHKLRINRLHSPQWFRLISNHVNKWREKITESKLQEMEDSLLDLENMESDQEELIAPTKTQTQK